MDTNRVAVVLITVCTGGLFSLFWRRTANSGLPDDDDDETLLVGSFSRVFRN